MAFGYTGFPFFGKQNNKSLNPSDGDTSNLTGARLRVTNPDTGRLTFLPVYINGELFPICTVSMSAKKIVKETPLTARRGVVNEVIRFDAYRFEIKGLCVGYNYEFPEGQIKMLRDIYEQKESVQVENGLMDIFVKEGKYIIANLDFPEIKGVENVRPFTMKLTEDSIFDLTEV
jgi:hypothetical protein